jgi:predicted RNA-binding Zn-ribbon protein involved in translation (DUF1610 family)
MSKVKHLTFTFEAIKKAIEFGQGFCTSCGAMRDCEPDARQYVCDECGLNRVYGAEELVLMGLVE